MGMLKTGMSIAAPIFSYFEQNSHQDAALRSNQAFIDSAMEMLGREYGVGLPGGYGLPQFETSWLTPEQRTAVEQKRWLEGPNATPFTRQYQSEADWQQYLWDTYGESAPEEVRAAMTADQGPSVMDRLDTLAKELGAQYDTIKEEGLATLTDANRAAKGEVARSFSNAEEQQRAELFARGLEGTTIMPTIQTGMAREEGAAKALLDEELMREKLGLTTQLGLSRASLDERMGTARVAAQEGALDRVLNILSSGVYEGPGYAYAGDALQQIVNNRMAEAQLEAAKKAGTGIGPGLLNMGGQLGAAGIGAVGLAAALSDRNAKTDITPVDEAAVLAAVEKLPIATWRYKPGLEDAATHIGPMADDFGRVFNGDPTGETPTRIAYTDAIGVLLATVKALAARVRSLEQATLAAML